MKFILLLVTVFVGLVSLSAAFAAAKAWYDAIDFDTADLAAVRRQAVDWVLRFRAKGR